MSDLSGRRLEGARGSPSRFAAGRPFPFRPSHAPGPRRPGRDRSLRDIRLRRRRRDQRSIQPARRPAPILRDLPVMNVPAEAAYGLVADSRPLIQSSSTACSPKRPSRPDYLALFASSRSVAAIFSYMAACSWKLLTRLAQCWGMALAPVPFPETLL